MTTALDPALRRPVILLSAPRAGSTLLFETLALAEGVVTVGTESHHVMEPALSRVPAIRSLPHHRLGARHAHPDLVTALREAFARALVDRSGRPWDARLPATLVEKTPRNALRVPFLNRVFPDARYVHLVRDPGPNVASLCEYWHNAPGFALDGWPGATDLPDGRWRALLPPGWHRLVGRPTPDIATYQWYWSNLAIRHDLDALPAERRLVVTYQDLTDRPHPTISTICRFAGLPVEGALASRIAGPLPPSSSVISAPRRGKWRDTGLPGTLPDAVRSLAAELRAAAERDGARLGTGATA